jgi:hypothetical protein
VPGKAAESRVVFRPVVKPLREYRERFSLLGKGIPKNGNAQNSRRANVFWAA